MTEIERAMDALAQNGIWLRAPAPDSELVRVELRRAARLRNIRIRTGYGMDDCLVAHTPDGFPAEEPWRGAMENLRRSPTWRVLLQTAIEDLPAPRSG